MSKSAVVTARVEADVLADLDRLAADRDRSRSWIVAKAVADFVQREIKFDAFIQEGEDAIDRGDFVTHDALMAEINRMQAKRAA